MRILSATCHSFGPFANQTLELAPGMNVIYGPNESGKSSWHAALYVGLCGIRRGPGKTNEAREFEERHRPWDNDSWEVSALIELEDGRRVELHHDLDGRVDCSATDADLGRDYSNEIISDGSPDGSRWLGLDRRSFLSTACVKQADIQAVVQQAEALQEHLQRAAATAGTDATAAAAITRLEKFQKEHVGTPQRNSTKPLRMAMNELEAARSGLAVAQEDHAEYLSLVEGVDRLRAEASQADHRTAVAEAAGATAQAEAWMKRVQRVEALAARLPREPKAKHEHDDLAERATRALHGWQSSPKPVTLQGTTADELTRELEALPEVLDGDSEVHTSVASANERFRATSQALKGHDERRPTEPRPLESGGLAEDDMRDLARELSVELPEIDERLQGRVVEAQRRLDEVSGRSILRHLGVIMAGLVASTGLAVILTVSAVLGGALLVVGGVLLAITLSTRGESARANALEELRKAESALGQQRYELQDALGRRGAAAARAKDAGLPADPGSLAELARQLSQSEQQRRDLAQWHEVRLKLLDEVEQAASQLASALDARRAGPRRDVGERLSDYEKKCRERLRVATEAARRPDLEKALAERLHAEQMARETNERCQQAEKELCDAASAVGIKPGQLEKVADALDAWLEEHRAAAKEQERAIKEWQELLGLLDGMSLEDLRNRSEQEAARAAKLSEGYALEEIQAARLDNLEPRLRELREIAREATTRHSAERGKLEQFILTKRSVPAAEEMLAAAVTELARVELLSETLTRTLTLLEQAEEKVHRDVAPLLRDTLLEWLPRVTAGRYTEARVDPESLSVQVRASGGRWRNARTLSHGTAEQIYLLLRMAMARHLTKADEICPLILDDVTAQSDEIRQAAVLGVLHDISRQRQIILFTLETPVMKWATDNLQSGRDHLVELDTGMIAA